MKKLLVIGAGFLQNFVIQKSVEMGYETLAVDADPNAVGFTYQCCSYNDVPQMTVIIKAQLAERGQLDTLDNDLIIKIVRQITVSHYAEIGIELINGVRLKNITEKGETGNE